MRLIRPFLRIGTGALYALLCMGAVQSAAQAATKPFALEEATIADIQAAIRGGKLTTVDVVNGYLKRIKAYNGTCVKESQGILGPIETIPHAGQINAWRR